MKKRFLKIISVIAILFIIFVFASNSFAEWNPQIEFLMSGKRNKAANRVVEIMSPIINFTQIVGMGLGVLAIVIAGIQTVTASASQKAEIKNKTANMVLGGILMFSATALLQIVKMFVESNINSQYSD